MPAQSFLRSFLCPEEPGVETSPEVGKMVNKVDREQEDKWDVFRYFIGDWTGKGEGKPGTSTVERSYRLILDDQYVEIRSRSLYEPQENNPSGEDHREIGLLSFDKNRSLYVQREFHVEGFVNQYVLEEFSKGQSKFVFATEAIENFMDGWRARTTLEILSENTFRETFELTGPDEGWTCYITSVLQRAV
jgi:hypothetical protein